MKAFAVLLAIVIAMPFAFTACGAGESPLEDISLEKRIKEAQREQQAAFEELRESTAPLRQQRSRERGAFNQSIADARRLRQRALARANRRLEQAQAEARAAAAE